MENGNEFASELSVCLNLSLSRGNDIQNKKLLEESTLRGKEHNYANRMERWKRILVTYGI